jgi:hypothetical protein
MEVLRADTEMLGGLRTNAESAIQTRPPAVPTRRRSPVPPSLPSAGRPGIRARIAAQCGCGQSGRDQPGGRGGVPGCHQDEAAPGQVEGAAASSIAAIRRRPGLLPAVGDVVRRSA